MNRPLRLLIVDDHPVVRDGLRGMLAGHAEFEVLGEAADGDQAVRLAEKLQPDLVMMDLRMPGTDGVSATAQIKTRWPAIKVLVLTTYDTDSHILRAAPGEQLSPREVDVLTWVARGASNKEIARHLHISEATVKSHLLPIFAKLEVNDRTQAVKKEIIHLE